MNKANLVSGTIKGIQIVDLGLKQNNLKNSSKKCMIKLKKNKNSSTNNSITNDSIISIKENISNKNTSISSKTKQQTSSISSNQRIKKIKDVNEDEDEDVKEGGNAGSDDEEVGMQCDYDYFGDTRNRKGQAGDEGYTKQNKGFKEDKRIYYIKEKKKRQRELEQFLILIF